MDNPYNKMVYETSAKLYALMEEMEKNKKQLNEYLYILGRSEYYKRLYNKDFWGIVDYYSDEVLNGLVEGVKDTEKILSRKKRNKLIDSVIGILEELHNMKKEKETLMEEVERLKLERDKLEFLKRKEGD